MADTHTPGDPAQTPPPAAVPEIPPSAGPPPGLPPTRHERSDVSLRWFKILLIAALILAAFIHGVILWFQKQFLGYEAHVKKSEYAYPGQRPELPPSPRLEPLQETERINTRGGITATDIYVRRAAKERFLNNYGRYKSLAEKEKILNAVGSPGEQELAHIPIARAMQLLVDDPDRAPKELRPRARKAPAGPRAEEDRQRAGGLVFGGGPNSGRLFQVKEGQR